MKPLFILFFSFVSSLAFGAVALTGSYTENFNAPLSADWTLSGLGLVTIAPSGYTSVINTTSTGITTGAIRPNGAGNSFGTVGQTFAPIKPAGSYQTYGFGGSWLVNNSALPGAGSNLDDVRSASIGFDVSSAPSQLANLSFQLGVGDSIDGGEGVFSVRVNGTTIWQRQFGGNGAIIAPTSGLYPNITPTSSTLTTHITGANLLSTGYYLETWNTAIVDEFSRGAQSWTTEAAYTVNLNDIAYTGSALNVEFVWRGLNSSYTDEFIALENFTITVPEPSRAMLFGLAFVAITLRRRRCD